MQAQKTAKKLIKTGIFAVFILVLASQRHVLAEEFASVKDKFSLTFDPSFEPADMKLYNVALALKSKTAKYPTFNVVIESGYIDLSASKAEEEKAFLDSYRLVGIKDVQLISSNESPINKQSCFNAELGYTLDGIRMLSNVSLFSSSDRRYILTFIDTAEGYKASKPLALSILSSFKLQGGYSPFQPKDSDPTNIDNLLVLLAVLLAVTFLTVKFLHRKHNT